VTKKYLFGINNDFQIYTYAIGTDGGLKQVQMLDMKTSLPDFCSTSGLIQLDRSSSNLYTAMLDCADQAYMVSLKIEDSGALQYLGRTTANIWAFTQIRFTVGTNSPSRAVAITE
jgi:hypothetical protein